MSLFEFMNYVRAAGPARLSVVTGQVAQGNEPYTPARDFYRRFLLAARQGRQMNNDRDVIQRAVDNAPPSKAANYAQLAEGWLRWVSQIGDTQVLPARTGRWRASDMAVKVTPNLVVQHPDGRVEAIRMYVRVEPLEREAADVMLWLMQQVAEQLHPDGVSPVVVDVRRGIDFRSLEQDPGFVAWMHSEAAAYRAMWTMVA
ncbi:MAG TPA: hypothetical protein VFZ32_13875 [Micromonosporaceae bacterium]